MAASERLQIVPPEVGLARRLVQRRGLVPRIDVLGLLRDFAHVEFVSFPIRIDGLCLDVKAIGKKPTVLVSKDANLARQRFTMAHELGHIIIPWHLGSIIDDIDARDSSDDDYSWFETEANRFASELLMPTSWVSGEVFQMKDPIALLKHLVDTAEVSVDAACIKLINCLPPGYVVARSRERRVVWSARSSGTLAATVSLDFDLSAGNPYPFEQLEFEGSVRGRLVHAWHFATTVSPIVLSDMRTWRVLLDEIVAEIIPDLLIAKSFKASLNGVTAAANGRITNNRQPEAVALAIKQRLHARASGSEDFVKFVNHPSFNEFCLTRACAFIEK